MDLLRAKRAPWYNQDMDLIETIVLIANFLETLDPDTYEHQVMTRALRYNYEWLEKTLDEMEPPAVPPPFKLHEVVHVTVLPPKHDLHTLTHWLICLVS